MDTRGRFFKLTLANADYEFGRYDFSTISATSVAARYGDDIGELTAAEFLAGIKYLHGPDTGDERGPADAGGGVDDGAGGGGGAAAGGTGLHLCWCMRSGATAARISRDYGQFVFYRIETLDEPPVAGDAADGARWRRERSCLIFSAGSYANGDYAGGGVFGVGGRGEGAAALDAAAGGAVTVARELMEPGYYAVTVLAASPDGAGFAGTARLTLSLTLSRGCRFGRGGLAASDYNRGDAGILRRKRFIFGQHRVCCGKSGL